MPPSDSRPPLAHLRHDLRTSINQILGFTDLLIEESPDSVPATYDTDLQNIRRAGKTLLNLINENLTDERLRLIGDVIDRGAATARPFPFAALRA